MTRILIHALAVAVVSTGLVSPQAHAGQTRASEATQACSTEALPEAERRAMETRFRQIDRSQGRQAAMAYAQEQGRQFRDRLIAEGVCTPDGRARSQDRAATRSEGDARQGSNCRLETRPVAGFGGAPMTMGMVTVCD